jgi:hypothetical protein
MGRTKGSTKQQRPKSVIRKQLPESLPTAVQKSYFMLSDAERNLLNLGLQKYRPGQSKPILIGGEKLLKPALRLMTDYRLRIDEIRGRSRHQLHPMARIRPSEGSGKSGDFRDI